ncbi:MAG: trigger factor [Alphaproteobacteria bacterium]|nr:trigger factor [Alphaproteobacteria bacterium]
MKITETNSEALKRSYKIVIPAADIETSIEVRVKEIAATASLPGFRAGKVPVSLLKQRYEDSILGEVVDNSVREAAKKVLDEKDVKPAAQPKIEITAFDKGKDLEVSLDMEILPVVDDVDFSKIKLEKLTAEINDVEIDETMKRIAAQSKQTKKAAKTRKAKDGDTVVIDYLGKIDGEEFPGGAGQDHNLELGSASFIPGFEEQLIDLKTGESKDVKVTFPSEYHAKEYAGKEAVFSVDIKEIRVPKESSIDDAFAENLGYDNLDAMKEDVKKNLEMGRDGVVRQYLRFKLLDALAEEYKFEVPEVLKDAEYEAIQRQHSIAKERGLVDEEDKDKSEEELAVEYKAIAERRVRLGLALAEVGTKNDLNVTQEEVMQAAYEEARKFPGQERAVLEYFNKNKDALESLKAPLYEEKAIDFILELSEATEKTVSMEELQKAVDDIGKDQK